MWGAGWCVVSRRVGRYSGLFSATRVPKRGKDEIVTYPHDQTFVIVQRGARFYKVHIMDAATYVVLSLPRKAPVGLLRGCVVKQCACTCRSRVWLCMQRPIE